jgi:hypothetical protein
MSTTAPEIIESANVVVETPERLRDYFLRLGAKASVVDAKTVRVQLLLGVDDETIADHLRAWVNVNGIPAMIGVDLPEPTPLLPSPSAGPFFVERPRLGDLLLKRGLISQQQLEHALAESRATKDLLGRVMIRRRFIFEDELARTLADQLGLQYVNLRVAGYDRSVSQLLPSREGMRVAALPIAVVGGKVRVAFADPTDEAAKAVATEYVGAYSLAVAELSDIELVWRTLDPNCVAARSA